MTVDDKIRRLIQVIKDTEINELEVTSFWGAQKIKLTKNASNIIQNVTSSNTQETSKDETKIDKATQDTVKVANQEVTNIDDKTKSEDLEILDEKTKEDIVDDENTVQQKAPLVGTFYRSSKPDEPPFIEVGDKVSKGQTLCIIEAMKIFNEIESDYNGVVKEILIEDSNLQIFSKNKFFEQWNEKKENELDNINFILPVENLDDIDFIKRNLDNIEESNLSRLVDNYEIKNSSILILRYDEKKLNVFLKTDLSGFKKVKRINFELKNLENKEATGNIILNLKYYINELWKEENLIDISTPSYLTLNTKIKDSSSLMETIESIKKISLIESYTVEELDNRSAKIKIKFFGKLRVLQERFQENGFEFKILNDQWNLYLNT